MASRPTKDSPLAAALRYARRGWAVLPVRGKLPLTGHGVKDATTDPGTIRDLWARWPSANVAIATGSASWIVVLDVDGTEGEASLAELEQQRGKLPATLEAGTPGDGRHLYFALQPGQTVRNSASKLGAGLDVRGDGGFVVAPPSRGENGRCYEWVNSLDPTPRLEWLADLILEVHQPAPSAEPNTSPKIREGQRNATLTSLAGTMRKRGMTREAIEAALLAENATRCWPPLPETEVRNIAVSVARYEPAPNASAPGESIGRAKKSQAMELADLVLAAGVQLFHTPGMQAFATIPVGNHRETWPLKSSGFKTWLAYQFYEQTGKTPNTQAIQSAREVLSGRASFNGPEIPVFTRLAEHDGKIYLDLADAEWRAVEISAHGWRVISDSPVRFRRTRGMLPLPTPVPGWNAQELFRFANIKERADQILFLAHAVAALRPTGPYPILALYGGQGRAKSTTGIVERSLIDPNQAALRAAPRDERDLAIAASNGYLVGLDNISHIPGWLSDALCRVSTGSGLATRELYTDDDEIIFQVKRPIILNGIEELAARGDLLDRMITIHLPPIQHYRDEQEFWSEFKAAHPRILGALLTAVSAALRKIDHVKLSRPPRMADFAKWATAAEEALGFRAGEFMAAYSKNRADANQVALESSPVGLAIISFLDDVGGPWEGTAAELLAEIGKHASEDERKARYWPKNGRGMRAALDRIAPNLGIVGVIVEQLGREGHTGRRLIKLEKSCESPSPTSPTLPELSVQLVAGDNSADNARRNITQSPPDKPCVSSVANSPGGDDSHFASSLNDERDTEHNLFEGEL